MGAARVIASVLDPALALARAPVDARDFADALADSDVRADALGIDLDATRLFADGLARNLARARARASDKKLNERFNLTELREALDRIQMPSMDNTDEQWVALPNELKALADLASELTGLGQLEARIDQDKQKLANIQWTLKTAAAFQEYLDATQLLLDCLDLAYVSDREAIEAKLFLPSNIEEIK